ncbi:TlpA family protein disulfide reductase [Yanghanlia caeni]|uniref:TlpA disulfide reductase family protein n=1 Tax=Yanghanlia caeni TaxID=3064283 RepID=A0ABU1D995_9BURK|nr:TlpA disulfide reductase family protein [Alcaligenaceae bacterium LG-2]
MKSALKIFFLTMVVIASLVAIAFFLFTYQRENATGKVSGGTLNIAIDIGNQRFMRWSTPRDLPTLPFKGEADKALSLADFRGKVVLLNIWATWCPPCREEMPSLDRLNAKRGGADFEVVALSIDRDTALVESFYEEFGIETLRGYFDPSAQAPNLLRAPGVPTTLLIDRNGREIGRALGPAAWDGEQVEALIDRTLQGS